MKLFTAITLTLLAATGLPLAAQNLQKEITVDHDIIPDIREAVMAWTPPAITLQPLAATRLEPFFKGVSVSVAPTRSLMAPVAANDLFDNSDKRGYVAAGYFPIYNLGISAGYRIVSTSATRLDAYLQFDGLRYNADRFAYNRNPLEESVAIKRNTIDLGLRLSHALSSESRLGASLLFTHDRFKQPTLAGRHDNRLLIDLDWTRNGASVYSHAGVTFDLFDRHASGLSQLYPSLPLQANRQGLLSVKGGAAKRLGGDSSLGLDASVSLLTNTVNHELIPVNFYQSHSCFSYAPGQNPDRNYTTALITFLPAWRLEKKQFEATIGAKIQFTFNSGKVFHIAPDINIGWHPLGQLSVGLRAGGGEWQNTLERLGAVNPWAVPWVSYRNSHIPLTAGASVTVGPFRGIALELSADYARANDWLMPTASGTMSLFRPVDMRGWKLGAALSYSGGRLLRARLSYETSTGNSLDHGWWLWADRSRRRIGGEITLTPLKQLELNAGWWLATGRKILDQRVFDPQTPNLLAATMLLPLSSESSLNVGGRWSFTDKLSVFLRGENLLNRRYYNVSMLPAQGIHGLAGLSYKF